MSELRDAIARTIAQPATAESADIRTHIDWRDNADDVLAMPELEAIRKALRDVAEEDRYAFGCVTPPAEALTNRGLSTSIIAWVLEGEQ